MERAPGRSRRPPYRTALYYLPHSQTWQVHGLHLHSVFDAARLTTAPMSNPATTANANIFAMTIPPYVRVPCCFPCEPGIRGGGARGVWFPSGKAACQRTETAEMAAGTLSSPLAGVANGRTMAGGDGEAGAGGLTAGTAAIPQESAPISQQPHGISLPAQHASGQRPPGPSVAAGQTARGQPSAACIIATRTSKVVLAFTFAGFLSPPQDVFIAFPQPVPLPAG